MTAEVTMKIHLKTSLLVNPSLQWMNVLLNGPLQVCYKMRCTLLQQFLQFMGCIFGIFYALAPRRPCTAHQQLITKAYRGKCEECISHLMLLAVLFVKPFHLFLELLVLLLFFHQAILKDTLGPLHFLVPSQFKHELNLTLGA